DLVLLSGDRLGDLSSSLERLLVFEYRDSHGVADDVATFFFKKTNAEISDAKALIFDPNHAPAGKSSLASLLPLLKSFRRIVTASRPLGAKDLMRSTEAQDAHPENPQGYDGAAPPLKDLAGLKARLESVHAALTSERASLGALVASAQPLAD